MSIRVCVQPQDFNLSEEVELLRRGKSSVGGINCFIGCMRDINNDESITAMTLEHYPGMTQSSLTSIAQQAQERWQLDAVTIIHRVGRLLPSDQIVMVATAAKHRGEAIESCEFIMDFLKTRAPFWKREETATGSHWVEARDSDQQAAQRWVPEMKGK